MAGLDGRCTLLIQLGSALAARPDICATGRPGDMLRTSISLSSSFFSLTKDNLFRILPVSFPLYLVTVQTPARNPLDDPV